MGAQKGVHNTDVMHMWSQQSQLAHHLANERRDQKAQKSGDGHSFGSGGRGEDGSDGSANGSATEPVSF
jgi:hypothetical protein